MTDSDRLDRIIGLLEEILAEYRKPPDADMQFEMIRKAQEAAHNPSEVMRRVAESRDAHRILEAHERMLAEGKKPD